MLQFLPLWFLAIILISVHGFDEVNTLKSISVVFRHGDRTPEEFPTGFYPNDPYLNRDFQPMGYGGLTNAGKKREYELGAKLRERYGDFLGDTYKAENLWVVSTSTSRTKQSLLLVLAGLYPPKDKQVWKAGLDWQPIPFTSLPFDLQSYMHPLGCPTFVAEFKRYKSTPEFKKDISRFNPLMEELSVHTGFDIDEMHVVYHLYHTLTAESAMSLPLPEWTKPYYPNGQIVNATLFEYESQSKTPLLRKLNGGLLTRKVLDDAIYKKREEKIHMYSCHEDNVAGFLYALNIWKDSIPSYGSGVVVELHEKDAKKYLKTLYYKGIPAEFEVRIIPECSEYCPLEDFLRILADQIPDDIIETCFGSPENTQLIPKTTNPIVWIYEKVKKWFNL